MRRETKKWAGRIAAAVLVTFALAYIPYHVYARSGLARTIALRRDLAALRARNRELAAENERLAREAEALRSDPAAIERVARADLGWVKPGEIVVELARRAEPKRAAPVAPPAVPVALPAAFVRRLTPR
jgi:cell division protein FtsB